jgi:hypothetical protein
LKIVNLTPHAITIIGENRNLVIEPSGIVTRISATTKNCGTYYLEDFEVPITVNSYTEVENLPKQVKGTIYIVSALVANAVKRNDLYIPNESVRDELGRIIGCKSLGMI